MFTIAKRTLGFCSLNKVKEGTDGTAQELGEDKNRTYVADTVDRSPSQTMSCLDYVLQFC